MNKVEIAIPTDEWGTLKSKYAPDIKKVLVDEFTRSSINIDTQVNGAISKRRGGITYNPTPLAAPLKDQYEAIFSDGVRHLLGVQSGEIKYTTGDRIWNTVVNGTGFTAGANFEFELADDRVYGDNGINAPIVYDRSTLYGGVTYTAPRVKPMGAQPPNSAPTAGSPTSGGNVPDGAHTYKITFVYYDNEESNGSPSSGVQTAGGGNNTIPLTAIPIGGYGVTQRKIYRDDNDGNYVLIASLLNNTATTFSDTILAGTTPLPTDQGLPPTFGQIVLFLDRLFVAQVPGTPAVIYFSEPGMYDIFPGLNFVICNQKDPIVALIVYQDRIIVFNRQSMGQILGRTSDQFSYSHIPGSVGCIDNRTIQTRTIDGVPVLVWLSDEGFYSYNGSSVTYISEDIEDQVNLNIQQASQQKGSHTDDTQAQFQEGTPSGGIDLTSFPGLVTTPNPKRIFDDQGDWESGSVTTNIVTKAGDNKLKVPVKFIGTLIDGALTPQAIISGTNLTLPFYPGEDKTGDAAYTNLQQINDSGAGTFGRIAQPFIPTKTGTLTSIKLKVHVNAATPAWKFKMQLWSGSPQPATLLFSSGVLTPALGDTVLTSVCSIAVTAGVKYWISASALVGDGIPVAPSTINVMQIRNKFGANEFSANPYSVFSNNTASWNSAASGTLAAGYTIQYSQSGQWLSAIYDTLSGYISPTLNIAHSGTLPALTSSTTVVEGSNDSVFTGGAEVSESVNNLTTNQNLSVSGKRYWRIRITLSSTDSAVVPIIGTPTLKFNQTATWVSPAIDATSDVTSYDSLTIIDNIPSGTSIVYTVATSNDDITYPDGFVTFGTQVTRRYIKIQAILTLDPTYAITPDLSSITLKWTISANFVSAPIDTGATPPAGWDVFASSFQVNGGMLQYQMRSAASLGALSSATFYNVTPGLFPPTDVTPLQFTQWKVFITSTPDNVPQIENVTITWFISLVSSIRCASIFVEGRYFTSAAQIGSLTNDIMFELDVDGKWRIHTGLEVSTLSFFFDDPYYSSSNIGTLFKFLQGYLDDESDNIPIDIRTKAFDFNSKYGDESDKYKTLYECVLNGVGTGATYTLWYSVDNGVSFTQIPTDTGSSNFTSLNDGKRFSQRFRVNFAYGNIVSGKTLMIRITTNDSFNIQIHSLKIVAWIRKQV